MRLQVVVCVLACVCVVSMTRADTHKKPAKGSASAAKDAGTQTPQPNLLDDDSKVRSTGEVKHIEMLHNVNVQARGTGDKGAAAQAPTEYHTERAADDAPASGAVDALVERQMNRYNVPSIDACLAETQKRAPRLTGTVTLAVVVKNRKVTGVRVAGDTVKDAALASCLQTAARDWKFSLAAAQFNWPVALGSTPRSASARNDE
jgi:hypothetical protein